MRDLINRPVHFARRIARSWAMARAYWHTYDFDWSGIAVVMHHQIRRQRLYTQAHGVHLYRDRDCRQMLITEVLLARMLDESGTWANAHKLYPDNTVARVKFVQQIHKQDMDMLLRQLRHLRNWWD